MWVEITTCPAPTAIPAGCSAAILPDRESLPLIGRLDSSPHENHVLRAFALNPNRANQKMPNKEQPAESRFPVRTGIYWYGSAAKRSKTGIAVGDYAHRFVGFSFHQRRRQTGQLGLSGLPHRSVQHPDGERQNCPPRRFPDQQLCPLSPFHARLHGLPHRRQGTGTRRQTAAAGLLRLPRKGRQRITRRASTA